MDEAANIRYNLWTSRVFIEFTMSLLLQLSSIVWMILDYLMFVLIYYSLRRMFINYLNILINFFIILLIFLLPELIKVVKEDVYDSAATRRVSHKGEPLIRSLFDRLIYKIKNKILLSENIDGDVITV